MQTTTLTPNAFFSQLNWIDRRPLQVESYRANLFEKFFTQRSPDGRLAFNLVLAGRAKKNFKTADSMLAAIYVVMVEGGKCFIVANDKEQAGDDLSLAKKIIKANEETIGDFVKVKSNIIERLDGEGSIEILPAQDAIGAHGKTYRLLVIDEIHGYRNWDLLEALAPDPTNLDAQSWITSYASLYHKPGAPLFDLLQQAKRGEDPRMLLSWYAADYCTDPAFATLSPELRANPSMSTWNNLDYLAQQQRRLPAHKFRRLHLNLPGLPEGSAFQPEPVMDSVDRGIVARPYEHGIKYFAFVDMSGGSVDDAVLAIGHKDTNGCAVVDRIVNQGQAAPFDPTKCARTRFKNLLDEYHVAKVVADNYAGNTFRSAFNDCGISYDIADLHASELYEALEPHLNGHKVVLLDEPKIEQQLLGLIWRGGRINHPNGEHDDWANAVAGLTHQLLSTNAKKQYDCTW